MKNLKYHLALITANLAFGANYSFYSALLSEDVSSGDLYFMRTFSVFLFFFPLMFLIRKAHVDLRDLWKIGLIALFIVVGRMYLMLEGMNYTSPIDGSIIATSGPIMIMVISALALHERLTLSRIAGIVIGMAGALTLILSNSGHGDDLFSGKMLGNMLILVSIVFSSVNTVFIKSLFGKYSPFTILGWSYAMGMLFVVPFFGRDFLAIDFSRWSVGVWGDALYMVLIGTIAATAMLYYGLRGVSPTSAGIYVYTQPVVATVLAIVRGQDSLSLVTVISAGLIFVGVYFMIGRSSAAKATHTVHAPDA